MPGVAIPIGIPNVREAAAEAADLRIAHPGDAEVHRHGVGVTRVFSLLKVRAGGRGRPADGLHDAAARDARLAEGVRGVVMEPPSKQRAVEVEARRPIDPPHVLAVGDGVVAVDTIRISRMRSLLHQGVHWEHRDEIALEAWRLAKVDCGGAAERGPLGHVGGDRDDLKAPTGVIARVLRNEIRGLIQRDVLLVGGTATASHKGGTEGEKTGPDSHERSV